MRGFDLGISPLSSVRHPSMGGRQKATLVKQKAKRTSLLQSPVPGADYVHHNNASQRNPSRPPRVQQGRVQKGSPPCHHSGDPAVLPDPAGKDSRTLPPSRPSSPPPTSPSTPPAPAARAVPDGPGAPCQPSPAVVAPCQTPPTAASVTSYAQAAYSSPTAQLNVPPPQLQPQPPPSPVVPSPTPTGQRPLGSAPQTPPAPTSPSPPSPEPVAVRKWETPRPDKRGKDLHFELDSATVPRMEQGVVPNTNLFFSSFSKGASAGVVLPTETVSRHFRSTIAAFFRSRPDAADHQRALAQLKVSCITTKPYNGGLVYVVQVHGREPTLTVLSTHVRQPGQAGALLVTVADQAMPFMLHRGHDSNYTHTYMVVAISSPHEVDPALLCDLMCSHTASPLLGCQWVGLVQPSPQGYCLAGTKGASTTTTPSPLPPWVCAHVKPGSLLALTTAFMASTCFYHYPAQPGLTTPPHDRRLPVYLRRVQNLVSPSHHSGQSRPPPPSAEPAAAQTPPPSHKRPHEDPLCGARVPHHALPCVTSATGATHALPVSSSLPAGSASPQHADKRREVLPTPRASHHHRPNKPHRGACDTRCPPPPPTSSPDLPPEVLPFLAYALRHHDGDTPLTPNSFQALSDDAAASYGADSGTAVPENANDVVEVMASALDDPAAFPQDMPDLMDLDVTVLSPADLQGLKPTARHARVHAWLRRGQARLSLMAWVEQSPFPPRMMPVVLRVILHHLLFLCFHKGQSVDLRSGSAEVFDAACQCLQRYLSTAPSTLPHVQ